MRIRAADPGRDAAACAAIYAPFVTDTAVSFEEEPPDADAFAQRIAARSQTHPWLVADDDADGVIGFAYGAPHRERAAYRWAVDVSVYVHERCRGRGFGAALYAVLLPLLARQGLWVACAGITLPNPASVALHERAGFTLVGVYAQIGWKAGAWRDVGWWQKPLRSAEERSAGPPVEPGPPPPVEPGPPAPVEPGPAPSGEA
jgi:phosphinothricin acetyltransferase